MGLLSSLLASISRCISLSFLLSSELEAYPSSVCLYSKLSHGILPESQLLEPPGSRVGMYRGMVFAWLWARRQCPGEAKLKFRIAGENRGWGGVCMGPGWFVGLVNPIN